MPSLFPSDEELPTWLHTLLLILVVLPFAGFLFWFGVSAIASAQLDPLSGPEFGQFFFGSSPLQGKAARVAGFSLLAFGSSFIAIAFRFSRLAGESHFSRRLPWILLVISVMLSWCVKLIT
ncbi:MULTISPECIES: hypothetical protein [unclassified Methyloversatilis]|uniref:hypothetical protein n=1 Tax=unclassified Methyloversatilis TaxID=2639971 RepID=UPI00211C478A|nr:MULTISPECIES: hypothetical protein [unclassified Methyloversatilis]MCQ9375691.1 hypothetical protein [Methyloversatilis sp. XJ19-13]MCQ9379296.1 hypothetical protein [Methyloversatilis sp. XJ19-49]